MDTVQAQTRQLDEQDVVCGGTAQQQEDDMSAVTAAQVTETQVSTPVAEAPQQALDHVSIPTLESRIQAGKAAIAAMKADPETAPERLAAAVKLFNALVTDLARAKQEQRGSRKYTTPYIPNHIYSRIRASQRTPQAVADEARSLDKNTPDYALKIHILKTEYKTVSNRH